MMPKPRPKRESNPAPAGDREQILCDVDLELSALRAQRRSGNGSRTLLRAVGLLLLLGLFAAGLGAMVYLQTLALPPQRPAPPPGREAASKPR
jgi:hypothetical protein